MKTILQFLSNIYLFISYTIYNFFFMILWYGKLPKVSVYHQSKLSYENKNIFENEYIQSDYVKSNKTKAIGADEFVSFLFENDKFSNNLLDVNIPIFDGKEIVGNMSTGSLIFEILEKYKQSKK